MNHAETIRSYYAAWVRDDIPAVLALCTEDVVAGIMPGKDLVGREAIAGFLTKFGKALTDKHYDIAAIVVQDDVAMIEGVESYLRDGKPVKLPFMTVFRFRSGAIASWRDYFDMQTLLDQIKT